MPFGDIIYSPPLSSGGSGGGSGFSVTSPVSIDEYFDSSPQDLAVENSWQLNTRIQCWFSLNGDVKLSLHAYNPNNPTDGVIATLPVAYRPATQQDLGDVLINVDGTIIPKTDTFQNIDGEFSFAPTVAPTPVPLWTGAITKQKDDEANVALINIDVVKVGDMPPSDLSEGGPMFDVPPGYELDQTASSANYAVDVNGYGFVAIITETDWIGIVPNTNVSDGQAVQTTLVYPIV